MANQCTPSCPPTLALVFHHHHSLLSPFQCALPIQTAPKDDEQHRTRRLGVVCTRSLSCPPAHPAPPASHLPPPPPPLLTLPTPPHKQPSRMMNDTKLGHSAAFTVVLCPIHPFSPFPPPSHLLPPPAPSSCPSDTPCPSKQPLKSPDDSK
ncbi:unnamed protein product [Cyclocybe aegerita]|uniref:Uncharacterized protein n=1 Tax=Cyclocybe aegerita TaxID=1973307 RepID=A0A8S0W924_CYCAE|nr:unnamed protein product [Cyclocybe aegerita]